LEKAVYTILLIIHNIALVGCAAAPFYNLRLVNQRAQFGTKLYYELDKVVEDTLQGLEPYCWVFIILLFVTGFGFPVTYYMFHGELKGFSSIVSVAFVLKHVFVLGMVAIVFNVSFFVNPKIRDIFSRCSPDRMLGEEEVKEFFSLRAKRKKVCQICFVFAIMILILSPILRFY
jgi:hypothetical protein